MIDVHAHVVLEGALGCAGHYGPELGADADGTPWFRVGDYVLRGVRYRDSPFMDVDRRLALNDRLGIDVQMLSPNPLTYFHGVDAPVAADFCRWHNEAMAEVVASRPDRFVGAAQLPMQDVDLAAAELERAVRELGLVAAYVGTDFGRTFDDPGLDPFWSAAVELDVPVFVHPAPSGIDAPARDDRLARYDLDLTLGFLYEETLAVACLCYGGVLDRHPGLDVCVSHGGGASALMAHRLHHAGMTRPWARGRSVDVLAALRRLWFDNHLHDAAAVELLERRVGRDRLVVGTNLAGWDGPDEPGDVVSAPEYDTNARRLLRLDR